MYIVYVIHGERVVRFRDQSSAFKEAERLLQETGTTATLIDPRTIVDELNLSKVGKHKLLGLIAMMEKAE